jgi:hypothetical protein
MGAPQTIVPAAVYHADWGTMGISAAYSRLVDVFEFRPFLC